MSSFKNAAKSSQKYHKERSQPAAREHLGLLEKKKDYKQRADDHARKQNTLIALKRKALDKNPDEFYFKMTKTAMLDGEHQSEDTTPTYTDDQMKLMHSQDSRYVGFKRSLEMKKIEKLQAVMHILDAGQTAMSRHTFFVESKKEAQDFDLAARLNTHPSLLDRAYNRPTLEQLQTAHMSRATFDADTLQEMADAKEKSLRELSKRISREKELRVIEEKMEVKKQLLDKKSKRQKIQNETINSAAVYSEKLEQCNAYNKLEEKYDETCSKLEIFRKSHTVAIEGLMLKKEKLTCDLKDPESMQLLFQSWEQKCWDVIVSSFCCFMAMWRYSR